MAGIDTKECAPLNLSAKAATFQFKANSPSFVPKTKNSFDPQNLPSASSMGNTAKKLTFYSPSQFYSPTQHSFYFGGGGGGGGYGPDGAYYGGYAASDNMPVAEPEIIADTVVFKNLPFSITDEVLMEETVKVVGQCVASVTRVTDKRGRFKGTAFIKFVSVEDADGAMVKMSGVEIMGRPLKLECMRAKGIKTKKKKGKSKKAPPAPQRKNKGKKDSPETTELVPAEGYEGKVRKVRVKSRGNSDMDVNWRSKTMECIDMPEDPASRAACQKLVDYKKSPTSKPIWLTVSSVDQLKQLIRVSKLINMNHQIEEVIGEHWKVKFTRKSFFENPRGGKGDRRFRSWSSEISPPLPRGPRGIKKR